MQVAGVAIVGKAKSGRKDPTMANNILLAGLAFQTIAFFIFLVVLGVFVAAWIRDRKIGLELGGKRPFVVCVICGFAACFHAYHF
jgi:hypothetical protein